MKKKFLVVILIVSLTVLNLIVSVPSILDACKCKLNGGGCTGNCCYLDSDSCTCFDFGTDDCRPLE